MFSQCSISPFTTVEGLNASSTTVESGINPHVTLVSLLHKQVSPLTTHKSQTKDRLWVEPDCSAITDTFHLSQTLPRRNNDKYWDEQPYLCSEKTCVPAAHGKLRCQLIFIKKKREVLLNSSSYWKTERLVSSRRRFGLRGIDASVHAGCVFWLTSVWFCRHLEGLSVFGRRSEETGIIYFPSSDCEAEAQVATFHTIASTSFPLRFLSCLWCCPSAHVLIFNGCAAEAHSTSGCIAFTVSEQEGESGWVGGEGFRQPADRQHFSK